MLRRVCPMSDVHLVVLLRPLVLVCFCVFCNLSSKAGIGIWKRKLDTIEVYRIENGTVDFPRMTSVWLVFPIGALLTSNISSRLVRHQLLLTTIGSHTLRCQLCDFQ